TSQWLMVILLLVGLLFSFGTLTDQPGFCQNHWVPYAGHCYYIERSKKIWKEASTACHKEGAFLASIHNIEEHSFVISQLGYGRLSSHYLRPSDELWIGLNDLKMQMLFEWTDGSHVTFTKWQTGEPSHASEECVEIFSSSGKWNNMNCNSYRGYICKTAKSKWEISDRLSNTNGRCQQKGQTP
uniref:C-type lectin domain-containing protein n=1 Tax=Erpetoichthys calabaricus TaxID=27687 RepID=A0A8C4TF83_ERPCA